MQYTNIHHLLVQLHNRFHSRTQLKPNNVGVFFVGKKKLYFVTKIYQVVNEIRW